MPKFWLHFIFCLILFCTNCKTFYTNSKNLTQLIDNIDYNDNEMSKRNQKRNVDVERELESYKILNILLKNYDKRIRPPTFSQNNSG